jgi:hypothetical protein
MPACHLDTPFANQNILIATTPEMIIFIQVFQLIVGRSWIVQNAKIRILVGRD